MKEETSVVVNASRSSSTVPWWQPKKLEEAEKKAITDGILEGAFSTKRFYVLLTLSTTIAALGLLANSGAVIIGAMIIAPLMGPILGLALGMVNADHMVERKSLLAELLGIASAIAIGYVIGLVPLHPGAGSEMLARTSPTVYDIGIALASGLAGAYASVNRQVNSALAGVAISVALVPPLATCGLFLAVGDYEKSLGAFLLFAANFFCIQTAAAIVFWIFRLDRDSHVETSKSLKYKMKFVPGIIAVIAMGWFMTGTLVNLVKGQQFEAALRIRLNEQITRRTGGRLDQILERQKTGKGYRIVASALTPKVLDAAQVRQIEDDLKAHLNQDLSLIVRSVVSQDMDRSGRVFFNEQDREESARSGLAAAELDNAKRIISEDLRAVPGATLTSLERTQTDETYVFSASVDVPTPITSSQVAETEKSLAEALGHPVRLIVCSSATTFTDRSGNLYVPEPEQPTSEDFRMTRLKQRITEIVARLIALKPARSVTSVDVVDQDGTLLITVQVQATQPVRPQEVLKIQSELMVDIGQHLQLSVRTKLESVANARDWIVPKG